MRHADGGSQLLFLGETLRSSAQSIDDVHEIELEDVHILLWNEAGSGAWYAVRSNERGWIVREADHRLMLRRGIVDPLVDAPRFPGSLLDPGEGLYLVQFVTRPLEAYLKTLVAMGGEPRQYIAHQGYLVPMDASTASSVAALPFVRWVGKYHGEYRLSPTLHETLAQPPANSRLEISLQLVRPGRDAQRAAIALVESLGGEPLGLPGTGSFLRVKIPHSALAELAVHPHVLGLDHAGHPDLAMDLAREIGGANLIENVLGFRGEGVRGEVMDHGFFTAHQEFGPMPLLNHGTIPPAPGNFHGASTSGIVFGSGVRADARGMLPAAQGIISSFIEMLYGPGRHAQAGELVDPSGPYRCVFQSHSWGLVTPGTTTGDYDFAAAEVDEAIFDHDLLMCQGMGNGGTASLLTAAVAKNVLSVGGVFHHNTLDRSDDTWNGGPSEGFTTDGRIKPDLACFYDDILTVDGSAANSYGQFGGTSGATPIVAGHAGLIFQMWHHGVFGNTPSGTSVFDSRMHAATAKAMLINTASPYPLSQANLIRSHQGWGLPDIARLYGQREQLLIVDEQDVLAPFASTTYVRRFSGHDPLRATLCYMDPMGSTSALQNRINDLTLKATSPSGIVYWGNQGLVTANVSSPGGAADTRDTVENIFVDAPEAGMWTFEVSADEINQDGHVETPALDADYALVVSGIALDGLTLLYGQATPGNMGMAPTIASSAPPTIGTTFAIRTTQAAPNTNAVLLIGRAPAAIPAFSGFVNVTLDLELYFRAIDTAGNAEQSFNVPPNPALVGAQRYLQWLVADPAAPGGVSMSRGLEARLGS